jgi:glucose-6-phosphate isomerase
MEYKNFDETASFAALKKLAEGFSFDFRKTLDVERIREMQVPMAGGLRYVYAAKAVDQAVLEALEKLASEQALLDKFHAILDGEVMNTGEGRMVLHHLLRGQLGKDVLHKGQNLADFYQNELERIKKFSSEVHEGKITGSTGKRFSAVCQVGIGGSDLGPRALYIALKNAAPAKMRAEFISNVDPDDASAVLASLPLDETLFILVSKSGTTQETLTNETFVKAKLRAAGLDPAKHFTAVTSETSPLAKNPDFLQAFYMDDFIGGRYSSSSGVGGLVLSLAFGFDTFKAFLDGAHEADKTALKTSVRENPALLDALIGVWERNFLGYEATAILPYSQALSRFPAHLQQLDMESNGKRVNREGQPLSYKTGPLVFGEPGTNGQHSFYQLLHQGTNIIPLQFIGFKEGQRADDLTVEGSTSQTKLKANLAAQIAAFALGQEAASENKSKDFPGGRPSSLIYGDKLDARSLGALLAHYENKVMFQGLVWNVNSFDQEGVQLGKVLTKKILGGASDNPVLNEYAKILGVN